MVHKTRNLNFGKIEVEWIFFKGFFNMGFFLILINVTYLMGMIKMVDSIKYPINEKNKSLIYLTLV
jgi:hypothetical protein